MGVEDAPRCIIVGATTGDQPVASIAAHFKEVNSQDTLAVGGSSSPQGEESAQIKEELSLILVGMLPLHYKKLVSASVHLALSCFHESVRCWPEKKLLKRALANNSSKLSLSALTYSIVISFPLL